MNTKKKNLINFPVTTTMEKLTCWFSIGYSAVLKYGEQVIAVNMNWKGGFEAAIYEFIETPEETGLGYIECRLNLVEILDEVFEDDGHAVAKALTRVK